MEVTFKKNLSRSYMCVGEQGQPIEEYELYILERHQIPRLLQMQTVFREGKCRYLYDISGKQQIEDYFSGRKIGYEVLQTFLFSIQELCVNLSEYLLREEGICLEMEYIYVSLEDGSFQFTYLPFYEQNLQEAFESCMEQFLRKIDHQDERAVELGYRVYQLCSGGNAAIGKLLEDVLGKVWKREMEEMGEALGGSVWEKEQQAEKVRKIQEREKGDDKKVLESEEGKAFWKGKGKWKDEWIKKKHKAIESVGRYLPGFHRILLMALEKMGEYRIKREVKKVTAAKNKRSKVPEKSYGWKDDTKETQKHTEKTLPEDADFVAHPTEILGMQGKQPQGKLVYQGVHQCRDILLEGESFLLGKNREQVDGVIPAEGVSRLHARISRQEDKYFIEDLNSTNGTYLNDNALEYHQPREIKRNDRVRFGAEEYLFL